MVQDKEWGVAGFDEEDCFGNRVLLKYSDDKDVKGKLKKVKSDDGEDEGCLVYSHAKPIQSIVVISRRTMIDAVLDILRADHYWSVTAASNDQCKFEGGECLSH